MGTSGHRPRLPAVGITIRDVAHAAGVSTATVSRALRGLPNVDEQTRARVQAIATELDYVISPSASRLASGRTGSIAVLTPYVARWFFATVLSGVESVLQEDGTDLLLLSVGDPHVPASMPIAPRLRRRVDGVLAISMPPNNEQLHEVLQLGIPTSLIGVAKQGVPSVLIDDVEAARTATRHLINLGHRRIAVIGGSASVSPFAVEDERMRGFLEAMRESGLEFDPMLEGFGHFTIPGGEQAMTALLTVPNRPTAVFALSDEMAFGAMRAMRRHGLVPGRDMSIIGIDGHDMSDYMDLTTVAQPVYEMGRMASQSLLAQLRGDTTDANQSIFMPTQLIVRGSTSPATP